MDLGLTQKKITKEKVVDYDKTIKKLIAAIGRPDLIEHQDQ